MNFSVDKIFFKILKQWYVVVVCILICFGVGLLVSQVIIKPKYESVGSVRVTQVYDEFGNNLSESYVNSIMQLSKANVVLDEVSKSSELKVLSYTVKELNKVLTIERNGNTIIVKCASEDPLHSQIITQAYLDSGIKVLKNLVLTGDSGVEIQMIDSASEAEKLDTEGNILILLFVGVGAILGAFIVALPYLRNKRNYEAKNLMEEFKCPVLVEIEPEVSNEQKNF